MSSLRLMPTLLALALSLALSEARAAESGLPMSTAMAPVPAPDATGAGQRESQKKLPRIVVVGTAAERQRAPSSESVVDAAEVRSSRVLSVNEVLRKVPGLVARDEEGFGIRPNIGVRGLNPTRSTKLLLLEDGIPASYAPYGDNASYYHAPVDRYERIEVLKGVGMLRFGPQSIGAVINYITPDPPEMLEGFAMLTVGNRDYRNAHARIGGGGWLFDVVRKQGQGARDLTDLAQTDVNAKAHFELGPEHALVLRATWLEENSDVSYTGLTQAEYQRYGREYGVDPNANFQIERWGGSLTHEWSPQEALSLNTTLYSFRFDRDWWRQSSTTTDTQCGNAFRDARLRGERVNWSSCNSTQGRLRDYQTYGVESRLSHTHQAFGVPATLEAGVRAHFEEQERRQVNAASATGRSGNVVENNRRETDAWSAFIGQRFEFDGFSLYPIVRMERIDYFRLNRLNGRSGDTRDTEVMPGLGFNLPLNERHALFASVHKGFAPLRAEDLIDNNTGGSVEVDAEDSRNLELGWRAELAPGQSFEAVLFRNHFLNQVTVGSVAGASTPLAQGEGLYQGVEFQGQFSTEALFEGRSFLTLALTLLPTARQEEAFRAVANGQLANGSADGKRLPYAPKEQATLRLGHALGAWEAAVELVYTGRQYSDFANTEASSANGQFGAIGGSTIYNFTLNYTPAELPWSAFLTMKNATDREYITDRTRGLLFGTPRLVQVGIGYEF